jgi:hypothetical protein
VPVACVLAVTDTFDADGARTRIDVEQLQPVVERMGTLALAAFG